MGEEHFSSESSKSEKNDVRGENSSKEGKKMVSSRLHRAIWATAQALAFISSEGNGKLFKGLG